MKIGYRKRFSPDGTVYRQSVRISRTALLSLREVRQSEIALDFPRHKEYCSEGKEYAKLFLKHFVISDELNYTYIPINKRRRYCYLNITQTRFANLFLKANLKFGRNTYLIVE